MGLLWLIYLVSCADRSCYVSRLPSKKNLKFLSAFHGDFQVFCDSSTHPPKNPLETSTWKVELGSLSLWVERIIAADPTAAFISKRTGPSNRCPWDKVTKSRGLAMEEGPFWASSTEENEGTNWTNWTSLSHPISKNLTNKQAKDNRQPVLFSVWKVIGTVGLSLRNWEGSHLVPECVGQLCLKLWEPRRPSIFSDVFLLDCEMKGSSTFYFHVKLW